MIKTHAVWPMIFLALSLLFVGRQLPLVSPSARLRSICAIQGDGPTTPYAGEAVRAQGIVYADLDETSKKGFFMQTENCDGNPATSDGIFVYLDSKTNVVNAGDYVEVSGTAQEYFGQTEISTDLDGVTVLSSGNELPTPIDLNPPFDNAAALAYFETLEGMSVGMADALVVGPTNDRDETWVVRADLGVVHVFQGDPQGTGEIVCVDDGGLYEIAPDAGVGDHIQSLFGALDYSYGLYRVQPLTPPSLIPATVPFEPLTATPGLTIVTFNLENLFDTTDDPDKEDPKPSLTEYLRHLGKLAVAIHDGLNEPSLIAVQEAENQSVLEDLVAQPEISADYGIVWQDGPDRRGIDIALLYREDHVSILEIQQRQGCTALIDGLGPDGNGDVLDPQNTLTCDRDNDSILDGNRLFSRPPLIVHLTACSSDESGNCQETLDVWVILNHWKSKSEDTDITAYTLPRRLEQAQFVADLSQEIQSAHAAANLIVLGDLNDYPNSEPLSILATVGLKSLLPWVESSQRYTYNYHGVSQVLDHILVSVPLLQRIVIVSPAHINADYPESSASQSGTFYRSSDHDPLMARFMATEARLYLPLASR